MEMETERDWFQALYEALPNLYKQARNRKTLTDLCRIKMTKPEFEEMKTAFVYITDELCDFVYDRPMDSPKDWLGFLNFMKHNESLYFVLSNDGCGTVYKYHTEQFYIDSYFDKFLPAIIS